MQLALRVIEHFVGETLSQPTRLLVIAMCMQGLTSSEKHFEIIYLVTVHGLFELAFEQVCRLAFACLVRFKYLLG